MCKHPLHRRIGIFQTSWKRMLRSKMVINRDNQPAGTICKLAQRAIMGIEVSHHEPATMQIDENRQAGCLLRLIQAKSDRTMWAWNLAPRHMKHWFCFSSQPLDLMKTGTSHSNLLCTV